MHDATNFPFPMPSDSAMQRAMWSDYYNQPCGKAIVSNQLCGWITAEEAYTGRIGDTPMVKDSGILEMQKQYSEADPTSDEPFTNVFDKGFRNGVDAAMLGQHCIQPAYSRGRNQQFDRADTLHSASLAVVRSGNERAVKRCKMSWFLKRGLVEQPWEIPMFCDVWLAWTFQVNFMYDKFL